MEKRKPLSDCSNTTTTVVKNPRNGIPSSFSIKSKSKFSSYSTKQKSDEKSVTTSTGSNKTSADFCSGITESPTRLRKISTRSAIQNDGFRTIYTRRRTVEKTNGSGKRVALAAPFDCPSAEKACTRDVGVEEDREAAQSQSCAAVRPRAQKKQRLSLPDELSDQIMPRELPDQIMPPDSDCIARQVAYFKDVDAFELLEEVVSEGDSE